MEGNIPLLKTIKHKSYSPIIWLIEIHLTVRNSNAKLDVNDNEFLF